MEENRIICPLANEEISDVDCMENIDVVDGLIKADTMPAKFKAKKDWREICEKCKHHNY